MNTTETKRDEAIDLLHQAIQKGNYDEADLYFDYILNISRNA